MARRIPCPIAAPDDRTRPAMARGWLGRLFAAKAYGRVDAMPQPVVEEYEPRLLYSADVAPHGLALPSAATVVEQRFLDANGDYSATTEQTGAQRVELLVVDGAVSGFESLLENLNDDGSRRIDVLILDPGSDGIAQITAALSGRQDISAVHILSHGGSGEIQLGSTTLDSATLSARHAEIAGWGNALTQDADILIYGCNVAADAGGVAFVQQFSLVTRADITASADLTGNATLGGDWNLEFTSGAVESTLAFNPTAIQGWNGVLANAAPVLSGANNLSTISEDQTSSAGTLVSDLIAGQVTDADAGALRGIAVTAMDDTNGTWQYSMNGGTSWTDFGAVSATNARLLAADANTYVRFVPDADFNGTVTNGLSFRAWDQTTGTAGATADTTALTTDTVRDNFGAVSYSNNDGTETWSTGWIDTDGNPGSGNIRISGNQLVLSANLINFDTIARQVDLSGATSATLSFSYNNALALLSNIQLQVSDNGGASYTTLASFSPSSNTGVGTFSTDISPYIATNTRIRFAITGVLLGNTLSVDNLEIAYTTSAFSAASASSGITVSAVNDAPVNSVPGAQSVAEDTALVFSSGNGNQLSISDVDAASGLAQVSLSVTNGTLTLAGSGGLAFTTGDGTADASMVFTGTLADVNAALNGLTFTPTADFNGAALLTLTTNDQGNTGSGGAKNDSDSVSITVSAVNDAPVATADSNSMLEDAASASGNVLANDSDLDTNPLPDTLTVSQVNGGPANVGTPVSGTYGALTLNADGSYSYALDNTLAAVQALKPGDTLADSFTYQVSDGNGGTDTTSLTLTISGVNDVAIIGGTAAGSVAEDGAAPDLVVTGALTVSDADTGESAFVAQPGTAGSYGTFTVDTAGNWSYTAANSQAAIQQLGAGATLSESFTVVAADASASRSVVITITGTNDTPVIGGSATAIVNEDASTPDLAVGGALSITDADAAESGFVAQTATAGTYGTFAIDAAGNWSYTALNSQAAIQQLAAGATLTETFNVASVDGTVSQPVIVTITGVNDAPVATNGTVTVDGSTSYVLQASDFGYADVEGESLTTIRITGLPSTGVLTLDGMPVAVGQDIGAADIAAGKLEFASSTASGAVVTGTLTFQVNDGTSYSASSYSLAINLVPVLASDSTPVIPVPAATADALAPVPPSSVPSITALPPLASQTASSNETSTTQEPEASFQQTASATDAAADVTNAAASQQGVQSATTESSASENVQSRSAAARHREFQIRPVSFELARLGISLAAPASLPLSDTGTLPGAVENSSFMQELDRLRESIKSEAELEHRVVGSAVAIGTGLSVGYVIWLLRGGLLVTSLLSSLPAWRYVDPLPVLGRLQGEDEDDDESLESMVRSGSRDEDDAHG